MIFIRPSFLYSLKNQLKTKYYVEINTGIGTSVRKIELDMRII